MTDPLTLPRLELGDSDPDFDEAVIIINGHEEETITVACEGAREVAEKLVRLVNAYRRALVLPPVNEVQIPHVAAAAEE